MSEREVWALISSLGDGARSTPYGIEWGPLRAERGGGIAGNSGQWWIRFPGTPGMDALGPFTGVKQLRKALRDFFLRCIHFGLALEETVQR